MQHPIAITNGTVGRLIEPADEIQSAHEQLVRQAAYDGSRQAQPIRGSR